MAQSTRQATRQARRDGHERTAAEHVELGIQDQGKVVDHLNRILADTNVLYIKTKNFHWNVEGSKFYSLHKLFEEHYEALDAVIDEVAERIRAIGGRPDGTFAVFLKNTRLEEAEGPRSADDMIGELVTDHEAVIRHVREDIEACGNAGDDGTVDLLTGLIRKHEKMAWMLRSLGANGR